MDHSHCEDRGAEEEEEDEEIDEEMIIGVAKDIEKIFKRAEEVRDMEMITKIIKEDKGKTTDKINSKKGILKSRLNSKNSQIRNLTLEIKSNH